MTEGATEFFISCLRKKQNTTGNEICVVELKIFHISKKVCKNTNQILEKRCYKKSSTTGI